MAEIVFVIVSIVAGALWAAKVLSPYFSRGAKLSETSGNYRIWHSARVAKRILFIIAVSFSILSVSPLSVNLTTDRTAPKDVDFILDVSRSMDAVDPMQTESRLERAKAFITKVVEAYPQNRYSLTVFAGEPYEAIPPTFDSKAFETLVSGMTSKYSSAVGTDLPKAISAVSERRAKTQSGTDSPTAIAIVLTDGGDAEDTPETPALRTAFRGAEKKISVLAVTFGSTEGASIPIGNDIMGGKVYLTKPNGETVVTKANPEAARRIADATDGESAGESDAYSKWETLSAGLPAILPDGTAVETDNGASPFVLAAVLAFFAAFVIPDKIPV